MKREILQQIVDRIFPVAETIIVADGKSHAPMLQNFRVDGDVVEPRQIALLTGADKDALGAVLRNIAVKCPENYVVLHICEVWYMDPIDEAMLGVVEAAGGPTNMASRKEGLSLHFFGNGWEASCICQIKRNPNKLEKAEILMDVSSTGRLSPRP